MSVLTMSLLGLNLALGDTGDTGDTGTIDDSGDTAVDTGADTGVDTGDTGGDTGSSTETGETDSTTSDTAVYGGTGSDTGEGVISAAALAGEKGGFGCAAVGAGGVFTLWVSAMVTGLRREEYGEE